MDLGHLVQEIVTSYLRAQCAEEALLTIRSVVRLLVMAAVMAAMDLATALVGVLAATVVTEELAALLAAQVHLVLAAVAGEEVVPILLDILIVVVAVLGCLVKEQGVLAAPWELAPAATPELEAPVGLVAPALVAVPTAVVLADHFITNKLLATTAAEAAVD